MTSMLLVVSCRPYLRCTSPATTTQVSGTSWFRSQPPDRTAQPFSADHATHDRRPLAHTQVGDFFHVGEVLMPGGVVRDEIRNRDDSQILERCRYPRSDAREFSDRHGAQFR